MSHTFERIKRAYSGMLEFSLANRGTVYVVWAVISFLGVYMITHSTAELAPAEDQGIIFGIGTTASNSTLDQNVRYAAAVKEAYFSDKDTDFSFQFTTPGRPSPALSRSPGAEEAADQVMLAQMQPKVSAIPGLQLQLVQPPALPGGGTFPVEVVLTSTADPQEILSFAKQLAAKAMETSGSTSPRST